jgi:hypothetical protein
MPDSNPGGGGGGCGSHGCPQGPISAIAVRPRTASVGSCLEALLALALLAYIIGTLLGDLVAGACVDPAAPITCAIAGVIVGFVIQAYYAMAQQLLAAACPQ